MSEITFRDFAGSLADNDHDQAVKHLQTLLGVDADTGAPTPRLAERHEESDGGRLHTFHLVSGVVFDAKRGLIATNHHVAQPLIALCQHADQ